MPDLAISALSGYTTVHIDDVLPIVDIHDLGMSPSGTTKKFTLSQLPSMIPIGGGLYNSGSTLYQHDVFTFLLGLGGVPLGSGYDISDTYPVASFNGKFQRVDMSLKIAASGQAIIVDILKSSNFGSTWTSLWGTNPSNRPTISANGNNGSQTSFDTGTYSQGDWFRIDLIQTGSGSYPGGGLFVKLV